SAAVGAGLAGGLLPDDPAPGHAGAFGLQIDRAGVGGELPAVQNRGVRVGGERQLHVHRGGGALRGADAHRAVLPGGAVVGEVDRAGAARQVGRVDHLVAGAADAVVAGGGGGRRGTQGGEEHRGGGDRGRAGPVRKGQDRKSTRLNS